MPRCNLPYILLIDMHPVLLVPYHTWVSSISFLCQPLCAPPPPEGRGLLPLSCCATEGGRCSYERAATGDGSMNALATELAVWMIYAQLNSVAS